MSFVSQLFVFASVAALAAAPAASALNIETQIKVKDNEKIAAASDALAAYTPEALSDSAEHALKLSADTIITRVDQSHYNLNQGCILLHTEEASFIQTRRAAIAAKSGATIVVSAKDEVTRIMNLSDRKRDSVRVIFGQHHISLNPGEELAVVCANAPDIDKAANEFVIRYRNAQRIAVSPEYNAVMFEFSLADAMRHCLIFKHLSESPSAEDHALLKEIIKTAAAVNTMFSKSRDKYAHGDIQVASKQSSGHVALKANKKKHNLAFNGSATAND